MILRSVCWSVFLCLALLRTVKAHVQVDEHGYQNVLISFAPNVPNEEGRALVQSIQDIVQSTSDVLHKAIGIRIASATFLLPPSWPVEPWENDTITPANSHQLARKPDISVDATDQSPFGKQPAALQHGGCGVAGHQITLPLDFVSSTEEYPKGKLLAREWLKYRYGVFDENGFQNDPLYPEFYKIPGGTEIRITECTDLEVKYNFTKPGDGEECNMESEADFNSCRTHPDEESAANVTSSLMYFHTGLLNMEHICGKDDHPHHNSSRNKQNTLCNGQSIWDVVKTSEDFKTEQLQSDGDPVPIQFTYIQESKPRFVVLLENSDNLYEKEKPIQFALRRFYNDLPPKSKLAIYTYNSEVKEILAYTELQAQEGRNLVTIADFLTAPASICTSCGLEKAMQVLLEDSEVEKGSILVLTASPLDKVPEIPEKLKESGICLRILRISADENPADENVEALKETVDCLSHVILKDSSDTLQTFDSMTEFLKNDVPELSDDFEIKTAVSGEMLALKPVTIPHDATASLYTLWLDKALASSSIECKTGDIAVTLKPGTTGTDIASFTFEPQDNDVVCNLVSSKLKDPVLTQVQITTQKGHYFVFDTWIQDVSTEQDQLPIIIYANIYFVGYPVRDANVSAVVTFGEKQDEMMVRMLDNGRGDPDVTQYDGIYSGYFTDFVEKGDYHITVKINDAGGRAKIGKNNPTLRSSACCGSIVVSEGEGVPAFEIEKLMEYTARNKRPDDGYPPSKIFDLQVAVDNGNKVVLSWTAPGGGKAAGYIVKLFQHRESAQSDFNNTGRELNVSSLVPGDFGEVERFEIPLEDIQEQEEGVTNYVTMLSRNGNDKKSGISNVAEFIIPKSDDGSTAEDGSTTPGGIIDDESARRSQVRKRTIQIVVGVLAGIVVLCILVYLGVYFFVQRPKRKEEKARARRKAENGGGSAPSRTASSPTSNIGLNSIPADVIVKHHNEVEKAKSMHKDPPIFKEENLDSINSSPELPENTRRNNKAAAAQYTMVQKAPESAASNSSQDPSKSPKRMTVV